MKFYSGAGRSVIFLVIGNSLSKIWHHINWLFYSADLLVRLKTPKLQSYSLCLLKCLIVNVVKIRAGVSVDILNVILIPTLSIFLFLEHFLISETLITSLNILVLCNVTAANRKLKV